MFNKLKGWKTVIFNVVAAVVPFMEFTEFKDLVPANYLPYYVLVITLGNVYLRSITTSAIGKK